MKTWMAALAVATALPAAAQDFPGYRAGNYTGVNGVFFNPANIADSRYRFDVNLFSLNTYVGNDQASFKLKDVFKNSFEFDTLKNQMFGHNAGASSGMANFTVHGPSVMVSIGEKTGIAFTTRVRAVTNIRDMDGKLVDKLTSDFENDASLPYTIQSQENMQLAVHGWTEFGVSFARTLLQKEKHFLKGGFTAKYLAGAANMYLNIGNFNGTLVENNIADDVELMNTTGRIGMGFGGVNISDFDPEDLLEMKSTGFGGDIGFVYEWRPDAEKHTYGDKHQSRRDRNKYKLKVGVALLDIGKINYERDVQRSGDYDINITGSERLSLSELGDQELDEFKQYFNARPQFFTPAATNNDAEYDVALPTSLQLDVDYSLSNKFYVHGGAQLSLAKTDNKPYNTAYYNGFTLTPRYEGRAFGAYLPLNYNGLTEFNAGLSLRFGPLFLGSGSVLSALMGESKQADFHVGLRFGGLHKNKAKKYNKAKSKEEKKKEEKKSIEEKKDEGAASSIEG